MQNGEIKDIKTKAKEAKNRLKHGFWQNYKENVVEISNKVKSSGVNASKVVEYYEAKITTTVSNTKSDTFYLKVKQLLDTYGEVSDAIGRLIDKSVYDELDYGAKQRYILELSENYRNAVDRYKREKIFDKLN